MSFLGQCYPQFSDHLLLLNLYTARLQKYYYLLQNFLAGILFIYLLTYLFKLKYSSLAMLCFR